MSCASFDWKAYALGELDAPARREADSHAAGCGACRDELAAIRMTLDSMAFLREEEPPRRIAFVSDKVFEPRWWQRFLNPTFAAACVVAAAIVTHAFVYQARSQEAEQAMQARIDQAVAQAVTLQSADLLNTVSMFAPAGQSEIISKQFRQRYIQLTGLRRN